MRGTEGSNGLAHGVCGICGVFVCRIGAGADIKAGGIIDDLIDGDRCSFVIVEAPGTPCTTKSKPSTTTSSTHQGCTKMGQLGRD